MGSRKIPVRTMSAAQKDTLAPWVQRVGVVSSRREASRLRGRPQDQGVTSPRTRPGPGVPTQPIPAHTDSQAIPAHTHSQAIQAHTDSQPIPAQTHRLPVMGAPRKALARRADALAGHLPRCHVGARHRVAGRPATRRYRLGAGRSMAARHRKRRRATGHSVVGHPVAGRNATRLVRPRRSHVVTCHSVARRHAAAPGRLRCCHPGAPQLRALRHVAAPDRPKGCRPGAGQLKARHRVAELPSLG
jgi:hypothetical protein